MSITVQTVADDVSYELRLKPLDGTTGGSASDFALIARWVDQTHKDLLHSSALQHMLHASTTVSTVAGTRSYTLTPTDIRLVDAVYDERSDTFLSPLKESLSPSDLTSSEKGGSPRPDKHVAAFRSTGLTSQFYRIQTSVLAGTNTHTLFVFPPPSAAANTGTLTIFYTKQIPTVSASADFLYVGEDARDAMAAGTLIRAYRYLHNNTQAEVWRATYERLKAELV